MSSGEIDASEVRAGDVKDREPGVSGNPTPAAAPRTGAEQETRPSSEEVWEGPLLIVVTRPLTEEIQRFFAELRPSSELAIILCLLPGAAADSLELGPSLGGLPLVYPSDASALTRGQVQVLAPGAAWVLLDGQLAPAVKTRDQRAPLNALLRSLAREHVHQVIVVLLSQVHADGAAGLHAIREAGGLILAEDDGSPDNLRTTSPFDRLLPRAQLVASVGKVLEQFCLAEARGLRLSLSRDTESQLDRVLALVRGKTGHDFRQYKRNTIVRRVQRRMRVTQIDNLPGYLEYVRSTPGEPELLLQDMLIGVTHFFRDGEAFELLTQEIIPRLVSAKEPGATVRVWSAGCATGEEAYSLAFLFTHYIDQHNLDLKLQVFATDIDEDALRVARRGFYPASVDLDIPADLSRRYLSSSDGGYRVSKRIRDAVIFSAHNLIRDPPFSRLDLISCRNLLIYLSSELQSRLLPLFHYALNPSGYLVLGPAEGLGGGAKLFSVVHKKQRIFQRREQPMGVPRLQFSPPDRREEAHRVLQRLPPVAMDTPLSSVIERVLLQTYAPACVVINDKLEIVYFLGKTSKYLQPPEGVPTVHLLQMARPDLRMHLRACVHQAMSQHETATRDGVEVKVDGGFQRVDLVVRPISEAGKDGLYLVVFQDQGTPDAEARDPVSDAARDSDPALEQLEHELKRTQVQLQTIVEEFETSNEELKSSNEELLSMNEELQSSNEELETAKEELQSVNEELETVNSELKSKVDELANANSDIRNLFENTNIAILFLDNELRIKNYTPATTELFRVIDTDRGRPIGHIAQCFHHEHFQRDVSEVIRQLIPQEIQVQSHDGGWFIMRLSPYRSTDNVIEGAVVTFTDVSELKRAQLEIHRLSVAAERQLAWLKALTEVVPVGIAYHEHGGRGVRLNPAAVQVLKLSTDSLLADSDSLTYAAWPDAEPAAEHAPLHHAITRASPVRDLEIELGSGEGARHLVLNSASLVDASRAAYGQVSAFWDITDIKRAREQAVAREQQQSVIAELGIVALDHGNLDSFLRDGLGKLCRAARVDACEVMRFSESNLELRSLARTGFRAAQGEVVESVPPNSSTYLALQAGDTLLWQRTRSSSDWPQHLEQEGVQSGVRLAIPSNTQRPFGLLGLYTRTQRDFSKGDLDFLRAAALVITSAVQRQVIEDARLREREAAALRRSEVQLRRAERLASLGTFAAGIAHELNNPLNNITLAAEYAEQSANPERRDKLLSSIKENAERCGQIVESVLRFARDEVSERWPVDANTVIRRSVDLMRSEFGAERLNVSFALAEPLPSISANPTELEQVFINLLRNAAEAQPGRCRVEIKSVVADPYLRVIVSDDGPGIAEADLARVFDPFFSTRRRHGGTGLGLSISHRIVTAHGGTIRVAADEGRTASFVIELPLLLEGSG
jgi:two-component system CheB/CheR fusion protein